MATTTEPTWAASSFMREARLAFEYSLSNFIWKQAVFFAERLVAECLCDETSYLLALAYFHNQETGRAYWRLQGSKLPEARYLLARCCFLLQKWEEAEDALLLGPSVNSGGAAEVVNGAAGFHLLGQVKEKQSERERAIECYARCLEICPFMWDAYERWSWLVLGLPTPARSLSASMASATFSEEKFAQSFSNLAAQTSLPWPGGAPGANTSASASPVPGGPQRLASSGGTGRSQNALPRNSERDTSHNTANIRKERRANPLLISGHGGASNNTSGTAREVKDATAPRRHQLAETGTNSDNGEVMLAGLLCKLGTALHSMHNFECQQTIQLLSTLPRRHYETGYVLNLVGLCHFEAADYRKAEQVFQQVWRMEPRRVEGLEYYSLALWHLRKDIELGHLAQRCLQWDRLKPQVWCVVGNSFSLQNEHDMAIKFFRRAIQVDPSFAYAYTLCGHEFVANEKFDKAIPMYERALEVDPRHYNAWWGLGNIYHRQEEHENARYHFLKALEINKNNSVLRCYLGMVLESLNNPLMALENFDRASQGEQQNGMAYFRKACVLIALERFDEALDDLKKVRCLAPKEACVHFQLGKVYMKLGRDRKALLHFNIAMDLNRDSKDYHTIKTHIERLHIRGVTEADTAEGGGRWNQVASEWNPWDHIAPQAIFNGQAPDAARNGAGAGSPPQQQLARNSA
mmetsp:Transcript_90650/g.166077  ORF Transcript_90650/g.166077 Transcript_90650/m.166077 type:complete len:690 (-) Transcript_90650:30-2099(-)